MCTLKKIVEARVIECCILNTILAFVNHLAVLSHKLLIYGRQLLSLFKRLLLSLVKWVPRLVKPLLSKWISQQLCHYFSHAIWLYPRYINTLHGPRNNRIIYHLRYDTTSDVIFSNIAQTHASEVQNLGTNTVDCRNGGTVKLD